MLTSTLRWREEFKVDSIMQETFPDVFSGVGRIFGKDKEGRPVVSVLFTYIRNSVLTCYCLDTISTVVKMLSLSSKTYSNLSGGQTLPLRHDAYV